MWYIPNEFKQALISNGHTPLISFRLYNDRFYFCQNALFGSHFEGTHDGLFYNAKNEPVYYGYGTATLDNTVVTGSNVVLGTNATIGSWTSQIVTPFYRATWDKLQYSDFTAFCDSIEQTLWFSESFESYASIDRNMGNKNFVFGTIEYIGTFNTANWLRIENTGNEVTEVSYDRLDIKNSIGELGEFECKFIIGSSGLINNNELANIKPVAIYTTGNGTNPIEISLGIYRQSAGTTMYAKANYLYALSGVSVFVGTLNYNTPYHVISSWAEQITGKIVLRAWTNGSHYVGTANKVAIGTYTRTDVAYMDNQTGTAGTYWVDDVRIYGTQFHGTASNVGHILVNGEIDYYIRTSTNGTNFTDWFNITGTRFYNSDTRAHNIINMTPIGTQVPNGEYAQFMTVMSTRNGTYLPYTSGFSPFCYYNLAIDNIRNIAPIIKKTESSLRVGEIVGDTFNITISNTPSLTGSANRIYGEAL